MNCQISKIQSADYKNKKQSKVFPVLSIIFSSSVLMMRDFLDRISKQFLCAVPLKDFDFSGFTIEELTLDHQQILVNKTVNSELVLKYPIKIDYQKAFIRYFVDKLEKHSCEVHDDFYDVYGRLVACGESKTEYFKHYLVGVNGTVISLKENINLISEGTTGLRTWQASLALAEWALKNKQALSQKNILELGSGIGLTGLVIALECHPKNIYLSDCHPSVLTTLCENININTERDSTESKSVNVHLENTAVSKNILKSGVNISVLNLPWEDVNSNICKQIGDVDLILAADVVYDSDLFDDLIKALTSFSSNCKVEDIVFACTERNPDTLKEFLDLVGNHFTVTEENCPNQENFIWCSDPPVRIFKFCQC